MVFRESLPEAMRLADPNTPPAERDALRREINALVEVVKAVADRNTQKGRHEKDHAKRDRIMAEVKRNSAGKPLRGELTRVARLHGIRVAQVMKWNEQLKKPPRRGSESVPDDWRTVYYGHALRLQRSAAARLSRKPKG